MSEAIVNRMLPNIGNFYEFSDIWILLTAILCIDLVFIFLSRYFPDSFGSAINTWYDEFGLAAVISDVSVIMLVFLIARFLYTTYFQKTYGWNFLIFIALLVFIQVLHDILFYLFVILPIPKGHNRVIDLFKSYSIEHGHTIIFIDSLMMSTSALLAMVLKMYDPNVVASFTIAEIYTLTYVLFTNTYRPIKN